MPWTAKDADKHKKGLNSAQKKKWASIANGVLKSCKAKGGKDCEGKAIRVANSKFSNEVPKGALRFVEYGQACCEFADINGKKIPKLAMTAYTGKVIKGHWWWGNLAIDLDGMSFEGTKFPILENHMADKKIAFTRKPIITDDHQLKIDPDKTTFVDTEASAEFQKLSADGFPYQASIYAKPIQIQRLMENEVADVNGFKFKGPGTIWRKCQFREASVCVFGWDTKTSSTAFSRTEMEEIDCEGEFLFSDEEDTFDNNNDTQYEGGDSMNWDEYKEKYPDEAKKFEESLTNQVTKKVTDDVTAELTKKFNEEKTKSDKEKETLSDKVAQLEKNDILRTARELSLQADRIFDQCLSQSDVSEHLRDKVKVMVKHTKFVNEDVLDVEKFTEAVQAEIKDWEEKGATSKVIGTGFAKKSETGENTEQTQFAEQNKQATADLLARAGQKIENK